MKPRRYKTLLLQAGILLFICALFVYILEQQKKYIAVDFSKQYAKNKTIELAGFEEGEQWRGNFSYDSKRVMEGESSITLSSWYGAKNSITWEKIVNIPEGYVKGYIGLFIPDSKNLNQLESMQFSLLGDGKKKKDYDVTAMLRVGWNRIPIVIPSWKKISQLSFSLTSKQGTITEVNLDRLWIENTTLYTSDTFTTKSPSLSLRTIGDRTYLYSISPDAEPYTALVPTSMKRGNVTVSLIPEHAQIATLSINNTSMSIGGINMNTCTLTTAEDKPLTKKLTTTSGKDNLYVFMKGELTGTKITYSLSNNGINYETCGQVEWGRKGPVQLTLQGSYLIDSYSAEY